MPWRPNVNNSVASRFSLCLSLRVHPLLLLLLLLLLCKRRVYHRIEMETADKSTDSRSSNKKRRDCVFAHTARREECEKVMERASPVVAPSSHRPPHFGSLVKKKKKTPKPVFGQLAKKWKEIESTNKTKTTTTTIHCPFLFGCARARLEFLMTRPGGRRDHLPCPRQFPFSSSSSSSSSFPDRQHSSSSKNQRKEGISNSPWTTWPPSVQGSNRPNLLELAAS